MKHILDWSPRARRVLEALLIFALAFMAAPLARAADATITCTGPTKYEDGTSIPVGTAITYSIYGAIQGQPKTKLATASACSFIRPNLSVGTHEWYVTATAGGLESAPSVTVTKIVLAPDRDGDGIPDATDACPDVKGTLANGCNPSPPAPPTNVIATTVTAYEYRPATQTMAAVGLIPEATTCGPEAMLLRTVMYCRVKLADSLIVVWPANRSLREVWAVKPVG